MAKDCHSSVVKTDGEVSKMKYAATDAKEPNHQPKFFCCQISRRVCENDLLLFGCTLCPTAG